MFCKYCGKEIEGTNTFCKYCGKAQNVTTGEPVQPMQAQQVQTASATPKTLPQTPPIHSQETFKTQETAQQTPPVQQANFKKTAENRLKDDPRIKRLKATLKMLSFTGWGSLILGTLFGVFGVLMLVVLLLTMNSELLIGTAASLLIAVWGYVFGVYQFWNAAGVEQGLTVALPNQLSEEEWMEKIRNEFSFQGAVLLDNQPDNALVYLLNDAKMHLFAQNGVLSITVEHSKRFNSAKSGGHWELQESFSADDLKCALAYFVAGQPLPENFAQEQKMRHKDKVGKVKAGIYVGTAVMILVVLIISAFPVSPLASLKDTVWNEYGNTGQTLGEAFENNFESPSWSEYEKDGKRYMRFDGIIDFGQLGESVVEVEFSLKKLEDSYYFLIEGAKVNGTPLSDSETAILMQYGFTGDAEELIGSLFLSALFG